MTLKQLNLVDTNNKKLRILKDKENKIIDIENKYEIFVKRVENFLVTSEETNSEKECNDKSTPKCEQCDFVAKNDQGLKVHIKAKHTAPQKFKCFKCDFSSATKEELTEHNDVYWTSHRMCLNPRRKKEYLEDFDQMKIDGFTVKESLYQEVLKWDD